MQQAEERYSRLRSLIDNLALREIALSSARLDTSEGSDLPDQPEIILRAKPWYEDTETGFTCFHQYNLRVKDTASGTNVARVRVVFRVSYSSTIAMDEELFPEFAETSLRLTTWPYLREYVHSTFARMNWPMFIAPTFRTGVQQATR